MKQCVAHPPPTCRMVLVHIRPPYHEQTHWATMARVSSILESISIPSSHLFSPPFALQMVLFLTNPILYELETKHTSSFCLQDKCRLVIIADYLNNL